MSLKLCPVECSACGELLCFTEPASEDEALRDFYCADCAATFTAIEPIAMGALIEHAKELLPPAYCAHCQSPITAEGWTCLDSCPGKQAWNKVPITARICS